MMSASPGGSDLDAIVRLDRAAGLLDARGTVDISESQRAFLDSLEIPWTAWQTLVKPKTASMGAHFAEKMGQPEMAAALGAAVLVGLGEGFALGVVFEKGCLPAIAHSASAASNALDRTQR